MAGLVGGGGLTGSNAPNAFGQNSALYDAFGNPMYGEASDYGQYGIDQKKFAKGLTNILDAFGQQKQGEDSQLMPWQETRLSGPRQSAPGDTSFMRHINPEYQLPLIAQLLEQWKAQRRL